MPNGITATASISIDAGEGAVWDALVNPELVEQYMFGATVESDWREGSRISWKGEWRGRAYEDHGTILRLDPGRLLRYSHFSPLSGVPDAPENYHTVTIELRGDRGRTLVSLSQDGNATESAREHSERNWATMLAGLKKVVEERERRSDPELAGAGVPS